MVPPQLNAGELPSYQRERYTQVVCVPAVLRLTARTLASVLLYIYLSTCSWI